MESAKIIKTRIKSIKNTSQITKAMEMVAASKMRKAQEFAINTRFYAIKSLELLANISAHMRTKEYRHYLLEQPADSEKICFLVLTSDKGLCGGFNSSIINMTLAEAKKYGIQNIEIVTVGKKGADAFKNKGFKIAAEFAGFGDYIEIEETRAVSQFLIDSQKNGKYKYIFVFYEKFISTLRQTPFIHQLVPLDFEILKEVARGVIPETGKYSELKEEFLQKDTDTNEYIFEPSPQAVLENILPMLFEIAVHYVILEANASEHSARMIAMKNASENARDILKELGLAFNRARQSSITKEISEISAGAEILKS